MCNSIALHSLIPNQTRIRFFCKCRAENTYFFDQPDEPHPGPDDKPDNSPSVSFAGFKFRQVHWSSPCADALFECLYQ